MLHSAEDAAGCHGSGAGAGGGGARLQLQLSSDQLQHPGGELRTSGVDPHHHMCGTVLPRGDSDAKMCNQLMRPAYVHDINMIDYFQISLKEFFST